MKFMETKEEIIMRIRKIELLVEVLLDYGKSRLEGTGYDIDFAINCKLNQLKQNSN